MPEYLEQILFEPHPKTLPLLPVPSTHVGDAQLDLQNRHHGQMEIPGPAL